MGSLKITRVPDQNGVSQAWYIVEIHDSGQKRLINGSGYSPLFYFRGEAAKTSNAWRDWRVGGKDQYLCVVEWLASGAMHWLAIPGVTWLAGWGGRERMAGCAVKRLVVWALYYWCRQMICSEMICCLCCKMKGVAAFLQNLKCNGYLGGGETWNIMMLRVKPRFCCPL